MRPVGLGREVVDGVLADLRALDFGLSGTAHRGSRLRASCGTRTTGIRSVRSALSFGADSFGLVAGGRSGTSAHTPRSS